jgi:hypothetical protein
VFLLSSWQKFFRSRIVTAITAYAGLYFSVILLILVLLLAGNRIDVHRRFFLNIFSSFHSKIFQFCTTDAIREIIKYAPTPDNHHTNGIHGSMELIKELRG